MRRFRKGGLRRMTAKIMRKFRRHRHRVGSMKGLTSVPVRFRGRRL